MQDISKTYITIASVSSIEISKLNAAILVNKIIRPYKASVIDHIKTNASNVRIQSAELKAIKLIERLNPLTKLEDKSLRTDVKEIQPSTSLTLAAGHEQKELNRTYSQITGDKGGEV